MPIDIDYAAAESVLLRAIQIAHSDQPLPPEWEQATRQIGSNQTNATFVFALGTALLAKATDSRIDTLSLKKEKDRERAYTARQLGHRVLRRVAYLQNGIHLGVTGREPLNNQPFFRYDRIDEMERVRDPGARDELIRVLRAADALSRNQAQAALAAFLRVRIKATEDISAEFKIEEVESLRSLVEGVKKVIQGQSEGGRVGQAFGAACLDLVFSEVDTSRVNDPSRNLPGDVRGYSDGTLTVAMEVRQKLSDEDDVIQYASTLQAAGVRRGLFLAIAPDQVEVSDDLRYRIWDTYQVFMTVVTRPERFLLDCMGWSDLSPIEIAREFTTRFGERLEELEVSIHRKGEIVGILESEIGRD